jgi:hypothetical protein
MKICSSECKFTENKEMNLDSFSFGIGFVILDN